MFLFLPHIKQHHIAVEKDDKENLHDDCVISNGSIKLANQDCVLRERILQDK